jgi:hypothetical protein
MTPVTGCIADADKQHLIFVFRLLKGFTAPWIPVYRVMGMLKKIWAFFMDQFVGIGMFCHILKC